jgi:hypothetical protein
VKLPNNFHHFFLKSELSTFWLISFNTCTRVPALTLKNFRQMNSSLDFGFPLLPVKQDVRGLGLAH